MPVEPGSDPAPARRRDLPGTAPRAPARPRGPRAAPLARRAARAALIAALAAPLPFAPVLAPVPPAGAAPSAAEAREESYRLTTEGELLVEQGKYAEAVPRLRRATAIALNSFPAHYAFGRAAVGARLYREAIEPLEIALELQPDHLGARMTLAEVRIRLGEVDDATAELYRILAKKADYSPALDGLGRLAVARGEGAAAREFFRRAIEVSPGYAEAYLHLGELQSGEGDLDQAAVSLQKALELKPNLAMAHNRLGLVFARLGLADEALASVRKAVSLDPTDPAHQASLGQVYLASGDPGRAAGAFEAALALEPRLTEAALGLAEARRRLAEYDAAIAGLADSAARAGQDAPGRARLEAAAAAIEAERDRVAALREQAAAGAPADVLMELAGLEAGGGRWANAADLLERAADEPADRAVLRRLAYYSARAGRLRRAAGICEALAGGGDTDPATYVNLGVARAGLGLFEQAAEAYRRALALPSPPPEARLYLGVALFRLGRRAEAYEAFGEYLAGTPSGETADRVRRLLDLTGDPS